MINRLSMKKKFILLLTPALMYMVAVSAILISQNYQRKYNAEQIDLSVSYFMALSQSIHALQKERGLSMPVLTKKIGRKELDSQRSQVDEKLAAVSKVLPAISGAVRDQTITVLKEHQGVRKYVDGMGVAPEAAKRYSVVIGELIQLQVSRAREYSLDGLESQLTSQGLLESAKENAGKLRAFVSALLAEDKPISIADVDRMSTYVAGISAGVDSPTLSISEKTKSDLQRLRTSPASKEMQRILEKVRARALTGNYEEDPKTFFEVMTRNVDEMGRLINFEIDEIDKRAHSAKAAATRAVWIYLLLAGAVILVIGLLSLSILREVVTTLTLVAGELSRSVSAVGGSSKRLSDSSTSLSSGVTEQAAALQETVSSLEEVRSMIGKNADHSKNAQTLATKNNQEVVGGKDSVAQLLEAVAEIHRSNESIERQMNKSNEELSAITQVIAEIGMKTKVINDIVFQTKLLSFNASVEAARADEHGKGFSVVAEEIGDLAMMSGNAAKEIVDLLENSSKRVDAIVHDTKTSIGALIVEGRLKIDVGIETAKKCGKILDSIANSSDELKQVISDVAQASQEQAQGVNEITKAMNQLEEVTHNNSTTASESATVATQLNKQTEVIEGFAHQLGTLVLGA